MPWRYAGGQKLRRHKEHRPECWTVPYLCSYMAWWPAIDWSSRPHRRYMRIWSWSDDPGFQQRWNRGVAKAQRGAARREAYQRWRYKQRPKSLAFLKQYWAEKRKAMQGP